VVAAASEKKRTACNLILLITIQTIAGGEGRLTRRESVGTEPSLSTNSAQKSVEQQWATVLPDGLKVVYTKIPRGEGFLYGCRCIVGDRINETTWESPQDLSQDEVERLPRFVDFLADVI
jgi:hypothetical protein